MRSQKLLLGDNLEIFEVCRSSTTSLKKCSVKATYQRHDDQIPLLYNVQNR